MNFKKFSKTIFAIISSCCLFTGGVQCLKRSILDARQNDAAKLPMPYVSEPIAQGCCGYIYEHPDKEKSNTRLIKKVKNGKEPKFGELHEFDIAHLMTQKDVPSSLMKVYYASNREWYDVWYEIEKMQGTPIDFFKENIDWDFFCRYWVIGLFEGMKYFQDQVEETELYDEDYKKVKCFALLGDRGGNNILVRTADGPDKYKPVHIDYSYATYYRIGKEKTFYYHPINELAGIARPLIKMLKNNQVTDIPSTEKCNKLIELLETAKNNIPKEDTLQKIISDVKKIAELS